MEVNISKTDFAQVMTLIGKAVDIIRSKQTSPSEYNVARQLFLLKRKIEKRNIQNE